MRIHILEHVPFEGPGAILGWVQSKGFQFSVTQLWKNETLPDPRNLDWLIIMGGPMSVNEEEKSPWLIAEKDFIRQTIAAGKTVLGICLGAQLIARVLGATVYQNPQKEIGWFPVHLTSAGSTRFPGLPTSLMAFHWHGETFDLPAGAIHLAYSEVCPNQAFIYNERIIGLQFHLESTRESVGALVEHCQDELQPSPTIQSADVMLREDAAFESLQQHLIDVLDYLLGNI